MKQVNTVRKHTGETSMNIVKAGLMAIALLLGSTAVAHAADICFGVTTGPGGGTNAVGTDAVVNTSPALLIGRGFGSLPAAGVCKDFRGFIPGAQKVWATGLACASSSNLDISFFMPLFNSSFTQYGSLFFPLNRSTLSAFGTLCTADTGLPGSCEVATVTKIPCPSGVTVPEGTLPRCPGIC
jgi:hypothetical protein